ncbi:FecR family protein [Mangrovibacterium diazotrophicum]|uniref:FecR family protein n=1 Tax=Mangrovibacterium diazotrophicum TaxID=1261403 RepID=A0A419W6L5_9BACT|nr:FecR domain-containing protein [Mangrovibacterium diazotrophicum]RKD91070.1 FecR family protein [Mangrovibacterium diazotrophicum]
MKNTDKHIDRLLSGYEVPATKSRREAWEQLNRKISANEKLPKRQPVRRINFAYYLTGAAAAAVILVLVLFNFFRPKEEFSNKQMAIQETILPDSSQVVLKTNSKIEYHERLIDGARLVNLDGEAFFSVTKGKKFQVDFPGGNLHVLGTKFNIRAYSEDMGRVDCFEGSVKLKINQQDIVLTKGQAVSFSPDHIEGPFEIKADNLTGITDNLYHWSDRPLQEILSLICAREGYQLSASESILEKRFTGSLNLTNGKQALTILTKAMNLDYNLTKNQLKIVESN